MIQKRIIMTAIICLMLSACQTPLERLHSLNPQANDFAGALASEYMAYSDSEAEQKRMSTAEYFAAKGLKASRGETVDPEIPATSLPKAEHKKLLAARKELIAVLTDDIKHVAAQKTARTQLLFDCWIHQRNSHINEEQAPCAEEFAYALSDLQSLAESFVYGQETLHTVQFLPHSADIDDEARDTISEIADRVSCLAEYRIELQGAGSNRKISRALLSKRFTAIRQELKRYGVPERRISLKRSNNSAVVLLSSDMLQDPDHIDIMLKTFGQAEGWE